MHVQLLAVPGRPLKRQRKRTAIDQDLTTDGTFGLSLRKHVQERPATVEYKFVSFFVTDLRLAGT